MKYCIVIPDGMADRPLEELDGRTPLEIASTPNMDFLSKGGRSGTARTIPKGREPDSDVALLSILGYDPASFFIGRAPLEALAVGVSVGEELVFRMDFVTVDGEKLVDPTAGDITSAESAILVQLLQQRFGSEEFSFYPGRENWAIMLYSGESPIFPRCVPPYGLEGRSFPPYLPTGRGARKLVELIQRSSDVLAKAELNKIRLDLGQNPANMVWFWGCGYKPAVPPFERQHSLSAGIITSTELVRGLGIALDLVDVPGVTAHPDTDYSAKAVSALRALDSLDVVIVHIKAPDQAGHRGDVEKKVQAIEQIDSELVGTIMAGLRDIPSRILIVPDHCTPTVGRTHSSEPVPLLIYGKGIEPIRSLSFSERNARKGELRFDPASELLSYFLSAGLRRQ